MPLFSVTSPPGRAAYLGGFMLALLLTLLAFGIVGAKTGAWQLGHDLLGLFPGAEQAIAKLPRRFFIASIFVLAVLQITVHLRCFLHVDFDPRQRLTVLIMLVALAIIAIVVLGSLWIMDDLNTRMSPPSPPG